MAFTPSEVAPLGTSPITPEKPGGEPVTYEPEFEAIKNEIAKIDSLKGETPDWNQVVTLATTILGTKSKDLTVAGYATLGYFRVAGYAGVAAGLQLNRDLLVTFWDQLYPEVARMRGRVAALNWVNERLAAAIARKPATASDHEAVKAAMEQFKALNETIGEKFTGDSPSMGDLRRSLEEALRTSTPAAAPAAASATSAAASGAPQAIDSPDAAYRVIRNAGGDIRRAAEFLVKQDPASPVPYLAQRGVAWAALRELPQDKDGLTQFPPPDPNVPANWDRLVEQAQWKGLLEDTEWRLTNNPLWLDINYYVVLALENLGHEAAAHAVADQTAALVRRFPKLLDLMYQDGRPFAQPATRQWLMAEASAGTGGGGDGSAPEVDPIEEGTREARGLAARGKLNEAVDLLQGRIATSGAPRDRFQWRMVLARILFDANQTAVAAAQLRLLDDEIEAHRLEAWEPGLAIETLSALYRCEKKLGQNGARDAREVQGRLDGLYNRLCRIDVLTALSLEGKK
jgi:type VI secretion system protein VasJ